MSFKTKRSLFVLVGTVLVTLGLATPAHAGIHDNYVNIGNYKSSKCIGIANGNAGIWTCTTNNDQIWHWGTYNGAGYRQLVNNNGQCLSVSGGSTAEGASIIAYNCNLLTADQFWKPADQPSWGGYYYLYNYKSGLIIGVQGGSTANGAPLVLWHASGNPDQWWF